MRAKWLIIDIFLVVYLLARPLMYLPYVYASPDEATWEQSGDTSTYWLGCMRLWVFARFYPYSGGQTFTMKLWKESNSSEMVGLKLTSTQIYYWDRFDSSWEHYTSSAYPYGTWLEAQVSLTGHFFDFFVRYADSDVEIANLGDESWDLGFDDIDTVWVYELSFTSGKIAFEFTDFCAQQDIVVYPQNTYVSEEFEDDAYDNWDNSTITASSSYVTVDQENMVKLWTTGSEPDNPDAPIEKEWWQQWGARMWANLQNAWQDTITTVASWLPDEVGDFIVQFWAWLDWGWHFISNIWGTVVSNLDAIVILVLMGYFFAMIGSIVKGDVEGIKDAFVSPMKMVWTLMQTIASIIQTIWGFIKFW